MLAAVLAVVRSDDASVAVPAVATRNGPADVADPADEGGRRGSTPVAGYDRTAVHTATIPRSTAGANGNTR